MFIKQQVYKIMKRVICTRLLIVLSFVFVSLAVLAQTPIDSNTILNKITVTATKKQNVFTKPIPAQLLNQQTLQQLNSFSVGDAAKYFSGVLIKDYGGVGGLKTISVRSLGASSTGVLYDGIPVADEQSGQIDLSKFSSTFIQSLQLDLANPQQLLLPARAYSSAAVLSINSTVFNTTKFSEKKYIAGVNEGSFGLWQPFVGLYLPLTKSFAISANGEATWNKGNYPYTITNGTLSQKADRKNSDITSFQGEINTVKSFGDSSTLQTKVWAYSSQRGLPGSIIFFNNISVQRLWDNDFFAQSRYQAKINSTTALLISVKYSNLFTRYRDPNFPNNNGGLDDKYIQQEGYASAAISKRFSKCLSASLASDVALTDLVANIKNFASPTRTVLWNNLALQFAKGLWQVNASLLNTNNNDRTKLGPALENKNETTPTVGVSYKLSPASPFLIRSFYKKVFRLPTFNDVYYNYINNINPKLKPEYTDQYDIGIVYSKIYNRKIKQFNISIDGYYNNIRDKIIAVPSGELFTVMNIGKVDIKGVDVTAEINGAVTPKINWSARIAYTWQQALNVSDPTSSLYKNQIPYTPNNSGSGLVSFVYKNWTAGYSMLFSDYRYALGQNDETNKLPGWITHDLFLNRLITCSHLKANIIAEVNNVFDERYDVIRYYPMPGRSYKISLVFNNL